MSSFTQYLNSGHVWLYVPVAILLGALHGLEPGHSKTMMTAFIIAIRGTMWQAVLLGLSAAISHSLLIWVLAALALGYGDRWNAHTVEPYLQLISAVLILGLAVWMFLRTRGEVRAAGAHQHHGGHGTADDEPALASHFHNEIELPAGLVAPERVAALARKRKREDHDGMMLDTGHGWLRIEVFENGAPPRFRIHPCKAGGESIPLPKATRLTMETARLDGSTQRFQFEPAKDFWESTAIVPEPHEFMATLTLGHEDHAHTYRLRFAETETHQPAIAEEVIPENAVFQDAHERAHADDIARRFTDRTVTTPQIVLFGITGGLMPCPAAFTILLVCLQLKKVALGFSIVGAFSFGLALTMVTVGAVAAWSVQHAQKRFKGFGDAMRKAPYVSCALLIVLACAMAWSGWRHLPS
ncbi:MAG TPA: sulfite exporter TauE/SafE family protein [Verrucomicrobiaceae bacterium]